VAITWEIRERERALTDASSLVSALPHCRRMHERESAVESRRLSQSKAASPNHTHIFLKSAADRTATWDAISEVVEAGKI
tara:strand:- start:532 stop:771 length:240 start_codon:yes stop_codon:yes gene_type:complete